MTTNGAPDGAASSSPELPVIPEVTLLHELARGGMGIVYRGRQDFLERDVAVKVLSPQLQGERFTARFRREAKLLAGIKHPHIVACHAAGVTPAGQHYLVMELVAGPDLERWITQHGPVPSRSAARVASQLAAALGTAHELGVIHRDIKPANILLETPTGSSTDLRFPFVPKLVDLGLARLVAGSIDLAQTAPGAVMGSPATMAPEQFDAPDTVDFRADIYGLGCVLYEMLTGAPAFASKRLTDLVVEKRQAKAPNPCERAVTVPPALGALVAAMLAPDAKDRPADHAALRARLDAFANAPEPDAAPTMTPRATGDRVVTEESLLRTAEFEFLAAGHDVARGEAFVSRIQEPGAPASASPPEQRSPSGPPAPTASPRERVPARIPPRVAVAPGRSVTPPRVIGVRAVMSAPPRRRRVWLAAAVTVAPLLAVAALPWWRHEPPGEAPPIVATPPAVPASEPRGVEPQVIAPGEPTNLLVDFLAPESPWSPNGRVRQAWRQREDGAVVALAGELPCLRTRALAGPVWCVTGTMLPECKDQRGPEPRGPERRAFDRREPEPRPGGAVLFAQAAVVFRLAPLRQVAIVCNRDGANGERWLLSLQQVVRDEGRAGLTLRPLHGNTPRGIETVGARGVEFTVSRRDGELLLQYGFVDRPERGELREALPPDVADVPMSLLARGGRVVFADLQLR